jgi:hypothetical protein
MRAMLAAWIVVCTGLAVWCAADAQWALVAGAMIGVVSSAIALALEARG